jgi:hypothetical protein
VSGLDVGSIEEELRKELGLVRLGLKLRLRLGLRLRLWLRPRLRLRLGF